eukprot:GEMP01016186.1.p1 GENE.GEMP01016186.1~~GEMP01016186.1.p1  ORF type:complete len:747 (+),score=123.88 GEMP01016186.1:66-2306(+)
MARDKRNHNKASQIYVRKEVQPNATETAAVKRSEPTGNIVNDVKAAAAAVKRGVQANTLGKDAKPAAVKRSEQAHTLGKSAAAKRSEQAQTLVVKDVKSAAAVKRGEQADPRVGKDVKSAVVQRGEPADPLVGKGRPRADRDRTYREVAKPSVAPPGRDESRQEPRRAHHEPVAVPKRDTLSSEGSTVDAERSSEDGSTSDSDLELKEDPIEVELVNIIRQIEPDEYQQNLYREAINDTRRLCVDIFDSTEYKAEMRKLDRNYDGVYKVTPFGSYRQRTNIVGSDLDLVLVLHCGSSSRDCYLRHLEHLQGMVGRTQRFQFLSLIPAKVPVLKLMYHGRIGQLPLDITIVKPSEQHSYSRDLIVAEHLKSFYQLQAFTRLVKHWAKLVRMNSAPDGSLNSASWVFLVLTYLKCMGLHQANLFSFKDLLVGFFEFMCTLGDITAPTINFLWGHVMPTWHPIPDTCIVIIDPSTGLNCAQALTPQSWHYILALCKNARCQVLAMDYDKRDAGGKSESESDAHRTLFGPFPNMPPFPASGYPYNDAIDGCCHALPTSIGDHNRRNSTVPDQSILKPMALSDEHHRRDSTVPDQSILQATVVIDDHHRRHSTVPVQIPVEATVVIDDHDRNHSTVPVQIPVEATVVIDDHNRNNSAVPVQISVEPKACVGDRTRRHSAVPVQIPVEAKACVGGRTRRHSTVPVQIPVEAKTWLGNHNRRCSSVSNQIHVKANALVGTRNRRHSMVPIRVQ